MPSDLARSSIYIDRRLTEDYVCSLLSPTFVRDVECPKNIGCGMGGYESLVGPRAHDRRGCVGSFGARPLEAKNG